MRSSSQPQRNGGLGSSPNTNFEDVLEQRLNKQESWLRTYVDLPLIDSRSRVNIFALLV